MTRLFTPTIYEKSIYTISYQHLKKKGIKCLLFDLDNTCVGYHEKVPNEKLKALFLKLKKMNFQVIIFSNTTKKRIRPFRELQVECHSGSKKPFSYHFKKMMKKYQLKKEEVCIIGDQLFTDILGGNRVGIMTCLVEPLTKEDFIVTKFFRLLERKILKRKETKKWKNVLVVEQHYNIPIKIN